MPSRARRLRQEKANAARAAAGAPSGAGDRLQRVMADAGVAARRVCEAMIEAGRVSVNGEIVTRLPIFVDPQNDRIEVDGRPLRKAERHIYLMVNKPERFLVTTRDEEGFGRRTVLDLVDHPSKPRLFPVGRLDYETTGLVLLTNDGEFANRLTHPRFGMSKTYWAVIKGPFNPTLIQDVDADIRKRDRRAARLAVGLKSGPMPEHDPSLPQRLTRPKGTRPEIRVLKTEGTKVLLEIRLLEARNKQIQDVLQSLGAPVRKLTRVAMGPLELKGLALGHWRELTRDELTLIRKATRPEAQGAKVAPRQGRQRAPRLLAVPDIRTKSEKGTA